MAGEAIQDGFEVFVQDGEVAFGAVREIKPHGKAEIVIYVENTGDFVVPLGAVREVNDGKVVLDRARLGPDLLRAIARAHTREDPTL